MKVKIFIALVLVGVVSGLSFAYVSKVAPLSWQLFGESNTDAGVGAGGYDVVSYHVAGKAVAGSGAFQSSWNNVTWYFSSAKNKALFEADAVRYAPYYGGFCAAAVSSNLTADIDPHAWHIEDGKLYLFYDEGARSHWVNRIGEGVVAKSDGNWAAR